MQKTRICIAIAVASVILAAGFVAGRLTCECPEKRVTDELQSIQHRADDITDRVDQIIQQLERKHGLRGGATGTDNSTRRAGGGFGGFTGRVR